MGVENVRRYQQASWSAMTRRLTSVEVEGDIGTLSPLVVVKGTYSWLHGSLEGQRTGHRPHNFDFWNNLNTCGMIEWRVTRT